MLSRFVVTGFHLRLEVQHGKKLSQVRPMCGEGLLSLSNGSCQILQALLSFVIFYLCAIWLQNDSVVMSWFGTAVWQSCSVCSTHGWGTPKGTSFCSKTKCAVKHKSRKTPLNIQVQSATQTTSNNLFIHSIDAKSTENQRRSASVHKSPPSLSRFSFRLFRGMILR